MATNTQGRVARQYVEQMVHYIQFTINYNDTNVSTGAGITQPWLPKGASILFTNVFIATSFNAGGTNAITVGTNASSYNNIVSAADVADTVASKATTVFRGGDLVKLSADTELFYTYAQTGAAATAGKAYVTIAYIVDNDINSGT